VKTNIRRTGNVVVFQFQGGLDRGDLPALERHLNEALMAARPHVVVDLAEATFLSSAALGLFVRARKSAQERHGELVIARPSPFVVSVLATLGLDRVFWIHQTADAAISSMTAKEAQDGTASAAAARPS
jgi:anti-sigma B factor antagonist